MPLKPKSNYRINKNTTTKTAYFWKIYNNTKCQDSVLSRLNIVVEWMAILFRTREFQIRISAWKLAILTELYRGFPQSVQANAEYHKAVQDRFLVTSSLIYHSQNYPIIQPYVTRTDKEKLL